MGTWTLWILFHAGVVLFLLFDLGLFHRRAHAVSIREAAIESAFWVAVSVAFGGWILWSHGRGPGLEFFTGYVIEKSLSIDNIFVFLLIFQYFRVDARYQHRLLFWGVLGALILRGVMIGMGTVLIDRFSWILYLFGAFLLYTGWTLLSDKPSVEPDKNRILTWIRRILPTATNYTGEKFFIKERGRWMTTPLFVVVLALETTDLIFAADSIPAVFGVTHDPFIVYTSNVCAILGLRAFYFLLAGILPYFRYLDQGLAIVLMFIGGKMLAERWIHLSTELSLGIVGGVIGLAILISVITAKKLPGKVPVAAEAANAGPQVKKLIHALAAPDAAQRATAARELFALGCAKLPAWFREQRDADGLGALLVWEDSIAAGGHGTRLPRLTPGLAVLPQTFEKIRAAHGSPQLASVPPDQDAFEFELCFRDSLLPVVRLDVLTTRIPETRGAIARFLEKFGEGIQQVELEVTSVERAAEVVRARFQIEPIYPVAQPGANATRVNFFLLPDSAAKPDGAGGKVLLELVETPAKPESHS